MKKNITFRKFVRSVLVFFSTCFLILMIWIFLDCFTSKSTSTRKVISYKVNNDISYDVTLKDNQFYTSEEANNDNFYVTSLMDTLQVYFSYELTGSSFFSGDYGYNVDLELVSVHNGDVVWEHKEEILPRNNQSVTDIMAIKVRDSVIIDINSLYNKAQEFYELTGYDVKLKVNVNVDSVLNHYEVDEEFNTYLFIVSGLLIISLLPITFMSYISLFNLINLDNYNRKLKALRKKYSKFIKVVDKEPDFKNKEVIDVITCGELARLCHSKDLVINLYEKEEGKECWFYVIDNKDVYIYTLELDYSHIDMSDKSMVINTKKNKKDDSNEKSE